MAAMAIGIVAGPMASLILEFGLRVADFRLRILEVIELVGIDIAWVNLIF
ncbi:MAG: hypothetical protein PVG69_06015 [Desulfobacterales bacterium]